MTGDSPRISKGSYCLTWDGFQSVAPSPQSQDSRCSAVEDRQRSGSNQLGEIEWFWMICYSQPTLLRQERCFQIVQPLNLWSPKSPDKNLPLGVLKLVVEIVGPICCPKKIKKSQWFQHWSFGWRGPINKQIALPNFKLLHCYRKKTFGHLTKPTNVVLFSSLPMAVDCRWRSLLHELTQATMTIGPTVVFWSWGLRFFFFGDILAKGFFETGILHLVSLGFLGGGGLNCAFYVFIFFNFPPLLKERIQFDDWLIFFNWVAQPTASWT